jgi:thiol-disulfide isomerase/thioredoxin
MSESSKYSPRMWWLIGLAFCVFWVLYISLWGPRRRALLESSDMSEPAAYEWSPLDLEDRPVPFARYKGKTVFLNIWATWCGPCRSEMPSIARLAENSRLRDKGVEFVCVSTDDSSQPVRQYLEGKGWRMTFLRAETLPRVFLTEGIPTTFLIAPDGKIAATEIGAADWNDPQVVAFLEKLAAKDTRGTVRDK